MTEKPAAQVDMEMPERSLVPHDSLSVRHANIGGAEGSSDAAQLRQQLASLRSACGTSTAVAPLIKAFGFGNDVVDASWPQTITVQCF